MQNKAKNALAAASLGLLLIGAGCAPAANVNIGANVNADVNANTPEKPEPSMKDERQLEVSLGAQSDSDISGKALLIEQGDKVKVMINVDGTSKDSKHPAHIHNGSCPNPGAVKWPLSDVVEGRSVTVIDASFDEILDTMPYAINIHKSADELSVYYSCGDLLRTKVEARVSGDESMMMEAPKMEADAKMDVKVNVNAGTNY